LTGTLPENYYLLCGGINDLRQTATTAESGITRQVRKRADTMPKPSAGTRAEVYFLQEATKEVIEIGVIC